MSEENNNNETQIDTSNLEEGLDLRGANPKPQPDLGDGPREGDIQPAQEGDNQ